MARIVYIAVHFRGMKELFTMGGEYFTHALFRAGPRTDAFCDALPAGRVIYDTGKPAYKWSNVDAKYKAASGGPCHEFDGIRNNDPRWRQLLIAGRISAIRQFCDRLGKKFTGLRLPDAIAQDVIDDLPLQMIVADPDDPGFAWADVPARYKRDNGTPYRGWATKPIERRTDHPVQAGL